MELLRDYIVVGFGLAGMSFCEQLERQNKSFMVFNDHSQQSSQVAGGMYNPVILKRFTLAWQALEQLSYALPFYESLEKKLGDSFVEPLKLYRRFASVEEQNSWFEALDKPGLDGFLSSDILPQITPEIDSPFGLGSLKGTGRIKVGKLLNAYTNYLESRGDLLKESFDASLVQTTDSGIVYKGVKAKRIVFATGYGLCENPFFNYLPLTGTKGELLKIKCPSVQLHGIVKSGVFLLALGNDEYYVGATYEWKDKTQLPSVKGKEELLSKLKKFLKADFEIVEQIAGIRPTVVDRRPLVGQHPVYSQMYVLNGLGTRGVLVAPTVSKQLLDFIEKGIEIDPEMSIARFADLYAT